MISKLCHDSHERVKATGSQVNKAFTLCLLKLKAWLKKLCRHKRFRIERKKLTVQVYSWWIALLFCYLNSIPFTKITKPFKYLQDFVILSCPEQESNLHSLAKTRF